ncbi:MAG: NAD-dependent epimerase/dehydratase family protein [Acidimicrobiia bacterium]
MRVMVAGLGGELGTRVAQLLEAREEVTEITGFDFVPPRRLLKRSVFRRIDPLDREKVVDFVREVAPTHIVHFGVYEPASRMDPVLAARRTDACTMALLGAAARVGTVRGLVVRSGVVVYGRGGGRPFMPDEDAPIDPTSPYGITCMKVEAAAQGFGLRHEVPVAAIRMGPVAGSHVPSPLGRVLRLPAVPVPVLADPPFSLCSQEDSSRAMVEALIRGAQGAFNVMGPGAVSPWQIARFGGRVPVPVTGPGWAWAARACELVGAPMPEHVAEVLRLGRVADSSRARSELDLVGMRPTQLICEEIFEWAEVVPLRTHIEVA